MFLLLLPIKWLSQFMFQYRCLTEAVNEDEDRPYETLRPTESDNNMVRPRNPGFPVFTAVSDVSTLRSGSNDD